MRFTSSRDNLVVQCTAREVAPLVRAAVGLLIPRHTKKLYFLADPDNLFVPAHDGLVVLRPGHEPSNFLQSFRLLLRDGELVFVSSQQRHFTQSDWRTFGEALAAHAA